MLELELERVMLSISGKIEEVDVLVRRVMMPNVVWGKLEMPFWRRPVELTKIVWREACVVGVTRCRDRGCSRLKTSQ